MHPTRLPFLQIYTDRHGRRRIYYRRNGRRSALRGPLNSPEFIADYAAVHERHETEEAALPPVSLVPRVKPFTYAALIRAYLASSEFAEKAPTTQAEYARVLAVIEAEDGHRFPRDLRRKDVKKRRDARAATPGAANTYLGVLSMLQGWAVDSEFDDQLTVNVCRGVAKMKVGAYRAWKDEEKLAYEARWPLGTKQRLAYALARYTGQRRSDLVRMTRAQLAEGGIELCQRKTDEELWIPLHRELRAAIEAMPEAEAHMLLLVNDKGAGFNEVYFGAWFAEAIAAAGLPDDCVLHGLRHSAASDLADAGASEAQIAAITGHRSPAMIRKYTRGAAQKTLARSAIGHLEKGRK